MSAEFAAQVHLVILQQTSIACVEAEIHPSVLGGRLAKHCDGQFFLNRGQ
jgi:hypothetical protein